MELYAALEARNIREPCLSCLKKVPKQVSDSRVIVPLSDDQRRDIVRAARGQGSNFLRKLLQDWNERAFPLTLADTPASPFPRFAHDHRHIPAPLLGLNDVAPDSPLWKLACDVFRRWRL